MAEGRVLFVAPFSAILRDSPKRVGAIRWG